MLVQPLAREVHQRILANGYIYASIAIPAINYGFCTCYSILKKKVLSSKLWQHFMVSCKLEEIPNYS